MTSITPPQSDAVIAQQVDEMIARAWHLLESHRPQAPPSGPPPGRSKRRSPSLPALAGRQRLEAKVGEPAPAGASSAARPQGQAVGHREFISAVQEAGALETAGEAERAAIAVVGELAGCLSWPVAQNLAAFLPRPFRQQFSRRSFASSMSRFSSAAFVRRVAEHERVDLNRAALDTRAVLLALDQTLPKYLADQLHRELASIWGPLTAYQKGLSGDLARTTKPISVGGVTA